MGFFYCLRGRGRPLVMPQNSTRWSVEVYENALSFSAPTDWENTPTPPEREEGDISSFSQSSRRRLIKKMLRLERSRLSQGLFVTLTYHREWPSDRSELKNQLNTFLQSLRREYGSLHYIWRVELQSRGAPHFHLILWRPAGKEWGAVSEEEATVREKWRSAIGCSTEAHARYGVDVRALDSWREALAYTSKYVAKHDDVGSAPQLGRRWAASQGLPTSPHMRLHINESAAHILRRICRKLLNARAEGQSSFAEYLKEATSGLVGLEPDSIDKLLSYLQQREGASVQQGAGPPLPSSVPSDLPERLRRQRERRRQQWRHLSWREDQGHCGSYDTEHGPSALHRASPPDVLVESW